MRLYVLLYFCSAFLFFSAALAQEYESERLTIYSDMNEGLVKFVQVNAEAYYQNLEERFFSETSEQTLLIYYSDTESDSMHLLRDHGHKDEAGDGYYVPSLSAIYTHRRRDNSQPGSWQPLFAEIANYFICENFKDSPEWFNNGLVCFLSERAKIINRRLIIGSPSPERGRILRDEIVSGIRPNIKRLFSTSKKQFQNWDIGEHFARAFFSWLYETGQLERYLESVRKKGYDLTVLEETISKSCGKINIELFKFIKEHCYAGAYLEDSLTTEQSNVKKEALDKALELKPDYQTARLELAKWYYRNRDYQKARENIEVILSYPESIEYLQAAALSGNMYYNTKNYENAREYYEKAWEFSDCYEYKYRVAYRIANCCYYLKDVDCAAKWYGEFLDSKWQPNDMKAAADFARKYLKLTDKEQ